MEQRANKVRFLAARPEGERAPAYKAETAARRADGPFVLCVSPSTTVTSGILCTRCKHPCSTHVFASQGTVSRAVHHHTNDTLQPAMSEARKSH